MFKKLIFLIFISNPFSALAEDFQLSGKLGTWAFTTENISTTSESASGFGAYNLQIAYALLKNLNGTLGLNMLMSDGISGNQGFGLDAGFNYYPLTMSTASTFESAQVSLKTTEIWRPYIGLHLRQRTFNFILSTTFLGVGLCAGLDYQIESNWFLNVEFRYDQLTGADDGEATQTNILIGAGLEF